VRGGGVIFSRYLIYIIGVPVTDGAIFGEIGSGKIHHRRQQGVMVNFQIVILLF
jgi:hypothetical protein